MMHEGISLTKWQIVISSINMNDIVEQQEVIFIHLDKNCNNSIMVIMYTGVKCNITIDHKQI